MNETTVMMGRVLRASTTGFTIGCQQSMAAQAQSTPPFGSLVRAENPDGTQTYGLVGDIVVEDDPFVRQLVAAGVEDEEYIADQRQRRQVPVAVSVLTVGGRSGLSVSYWLPTQPPGTLDRIYGCTGAGDRALHRAARLAAHRLGGEHAACGRAARRGAARRGCGTAARSARELPGERRPRAGEAAGARLDTPGGHPQTTEGSLNIAETYCVVRIP